MCPDDLTGNRKSHACALEVLPPAAAIELIEDTGLLGLANAWPLVGHVNHYAFLAGFSADQNWTARPRVLRSVIDQMRVHQHDQLIVHKHQGQVIVHLQFEISAVGMRLRLPKRSRKQRAWKVNFPIQLKLAD